jgi:glycine cleavage system H protein
MSKAAPAGLSYTKDHEWARTEGADGGSVTIGVTAFAVEQLGDITLVNFDVKVGDAVEAGKTFGTIESVKTLSDLFAPVSGTVTQVNEALHDKPELVNDDCYGAGWMVTIAKAAGSTTSELLDEAAYEAHVKASS